MTNIFVTYQLARVASVPARKAFPLSGREKLVGVAARKLEREQIIDEVGAVGAREGTLARKPVDFDKPVRLRMGLLISAAWPSLLTNVSKLLECFQQ